MEQGGNGGDGDGDYDDDYDDGDDGVLWYDGQLPSLTIIMSLRPR